MGFLKSITRPISKFLDKIVPNEIKPALPYLDVIRGVKKQVTCPVAAYQVSGEYAMIKAAAQNSWMDENKSMMESLLGIKRAGADIIITYFADAAARLIVSKL